MTTHTKAIRKRRSLAVAAGFGLAVLTPSLWSRAEGKEMGICPSTGALAFAPDGTLFVETISLMQSLLIQRGLDRFAPIDSKAPPLEIESIGDRVAFVVPAKLGQVDVNGMTVHPTSREIYLQSLAQAVEL